ISGANIWATASTLVNGTNVPAANLTNSTTVTFAVSGTNVSASANTSSVSETLSNKTIDAATNVLKMRGYITLPTPFIADGVGATIVTNDNSSAVFGTALFANGGMASTNWVEYRISVPHDIDTGVDLKVECFHFR